MNTFNGNKFSQWSPMRAMNTNSRRDTETMIAEDEPAYTPKRKNNCWKYTRRTFIFLLGSAALIIAIIALLRKFPTNPAEDITGTWLPPGPGFTTPLPSQGKVGQYYLDSGSQEAWHKVGPGFSGFQWPLRQFSSQSKRSLESQSTGSWIRVTDGNRLGGDLSGTTLNGTVDFVGGLNASYINQGINLAFALNSSSGGGNSSGYVLPRDIPADSILFPAGNITHPSDSRLVYRGLNTLVFENTTGGPVTVNVIGSLLQNGVLVGDVYAPLTSVTPGSFATFVSQNQLGFTDLIRIGPDGDTFIVNGTIDAKNLTIANVSILTYINDVVDNVMPNDTYIRQIVTEIVQNITLSPNATEVEIIVNQILANYTFNPNATLIQEIVLATLANYTFNPNATLIQEIVLATLANYTFNPNITLLNELIYQALATVNVTIPPPNVTLIREIVIEELADFNFTQNNFTLPERLVYGPLTPSIANGAIPYFFDTSGRNITASPALYFTGNNSFFFTSINLASLTASSAITGSTLTGTTSVTTPIVSATTRVATPRVESAGTLTLAPTGLSISASSSNLVNLAAIDSTISGSANHRFAMIGNWNEFWITNGANTGNIRFQTAGGGNAGFMSIAFNGGNNNAGEFRSNTAKNRYRIVVDQRGVTDVLNIDGFDGTSSVNYVSLGPSLTAPARFNTGVATNSITSQSGNLVVNSAGPDVTFSGKVLTNFLGVAAAFAPLTPLGGTPVSGTLFIRYNRIGPLVFVEISGFVTVTAPAIDLSFGTIPVQYQPDGVTCVGTQFVSEDVPGGAPLSVNICTNTLLFDFANSGDSFPAGYIVKASNPPLSFVYRAA